MVGVLPAVYNEDLPAVAGIPKCPKRRGIDGRQTGFAPIGHGRSWRSGACDPLVLQDLIFLNPGNIRSLAQLGDQSFFCPDKDHIGDPIWNHLALIGIPGHADVFENWRLGDLSLCLQRLDQSGNLLRSGIIGSKEIGRKSVGVYPVFQYNKYFVKRIFRAILNFRHQAGVNRTRVKVLGSEH